MVRVLEVELYSHVTLFPSAPHSPEVAGNAPAVTLIPTMHEIIMQNDRNTLRILCLVRFIFVILSILFPAFAG